MSGRGIGLDDILGRAGISGCGVGVPGPSVGMLSIEGKSETGLCCGYGIRLIRGLPSKYCRTERNK